MNQQHIIDKVNAIRTHLTTSFFEREDVIDGLLTALVARQHILLIGLPGSAKSAITDELSQLIDGYKYFEWLMTKFTTPEELFGPYDLQKLKVGVYERITTGKLPEAHFGYLDEVFKASSAILNALLKIANERVFYNGTNAVRVPLGTLVGTSNEFPEEEELQAVYDRFVFRFQPGYIREEHNFIAMLTSPRPARPNLLTLHELQQLQQAAKLIKIDRSVAEALLNLKNDLIQEGITLSDRRWRQIATDVLPARAVLAGRDHIIIEEDAEILQHTLWDDPSQVAKVASIVRKRLDPVAGQIAELIEDARDIANNAMKANEDQAVQVGTEAVKKLKHIKQEIQAFKTAGGSPSKIARIEEAELKVDALLKGVMSKCLGI
ncbi:AAA family ATPase (plasmid) [Alicyclobacillus acidoterrestris]|uniref:AAA family ATPase n=1 Tax=Alicyclobacillus acidoterrestris (strain ATCC 49025 / DSM 3922 / CIP 106132 / NCIMB 13137 / GD3B) TaxID=1356854 RepID=A0A9E6ZPX9_ALIAG|nr:AAA family ATPase [Alicyclobacillus acidoterrestris]UNO51056.1 AAA family ATPase [Alicyclobacillus acidoterrestris]GEO27902.1 hypothetical protein AAC03nite_36870 [Alicyclobacillus acidoterrestris]